jgi:thiol-disulfide isomerase/thioredoxin
LVRRLVVIALVLAAFGLFIWAGIVNYHVRQAKKLAAAAPAPWMVNAPENGSPTSAPSNAPAEQQAPPSPLLNKPAPVFTLVDLQGKKVSLASFRGRPVMVNFWATWCGPCKVEIPWFEKLHDQYAGQGFEILGVSTDELDLDDKAKLSTEKAEVVKFAKGMQMNYPVLLNGLSLKGYGELDSFPTSFYVDRSGKVVDVEVGLISRDEIEANIKKALGSGKA